MQKTPGQISLYQQSATYFPSYVKDRYSVTDITLQGICQLTPVTAETEAIC